jgi:hypothetical protein
LWAVLALIVLTSVSFTHEMLDPEVALAGGCEGGAYIAGECEVWAGGCFQPGWTQCMADGCDFFYDEEPEYTACVHGALVYCEFPGCAGPPAYCGIEECS